MEIRQGNISTLTKDEALTIMKLVYKVWPPENGETIDYEQKTNEYLDAKADFIVIYENNKLLAHAITFLRTIKINNDHINVMGLAGVCVDPEERGRGLGRKIIEKAFEDVDNGRYELCLYQTAVPGFYEKLGAKIVDNKFFNSKNTENPGKNPWWDDFVMIYPADYNWPDGDIDLNGPGY